MKQFAQLKKDRGDTAKKYQARQERSSYPQSASAQQPPGKSPYNGGKCLQMPRNALKCPLTATAYAQPRLCVLITISDLLIFIHLFIPQWQQGMNILIFHLGVSLCETLSGLPRRCAV